MPLSELVVGRKLSCAFSDLEKRLLEALAIEPNGDDRVRAVDRRCRALGA